MSASVSGVPPNVVVVVAEPPLMVLGLVGVRLVTTVAPVVVVLCELVVSDAAAALNEAEVQFVVVNCTVVEVVVMETEGDEPSVVTVVTSTSRIRRMSRLLLPLLVAVQPQVVCGP